MNIPPALSKIMENSINEWDFDVLSFDSKCNGDTLKYMSVYLFLHHNVLRKYKISYDLLDEFMNNLQIGYAKNNNPFYNAIHAADVLQTVHYFIQNFKLSNWLTDLQIFVLLFSAVIHDHDDPGVSNSFLIKTNNYLSLIYNDSQIKENHHISSVFKIFQNPKCMFLRGLNKNEYSEFRKNVIECVLNADLSQHFHHLKTIKGELASGNEIDKMKVVEFLLHAADISNPAKVWSLHNKWVEMWQEQMMKQGDLEFVLNIPYSPLCSRKSIYTAEIQTNVLTYITEPTFQLVEQLLETIRPPIPLTKSLSELTIQPTLSKHNSGSSSMGKAYPWGNRIVLNKSMWSRMTLARTRSNQTPTLDSN